jgi:SAM-dependent methyltransferase
MDDARGGAEGCIACHADAVAPMGESNGYEIVACKGCGLRYVPPRSLDQVDYDDVYHSTGLYPKSVSASATSSDGPPPGLTRTLRHAKKAIEGIRPKTLLDVGCGTGRFLIHLEGSGIECAGVEPSANAVEVARKRLSCPVEHGVLSEDVFPGRTFDVVTSWEVIEHVTNIDDYMENLARRVGPGGRLFLSTPNYGSSWMWDDLEKDPRGQPPLHVVFWDARSLGSYLGRWFSSVDVRQFSVPVAAAARSERPLARFRAAASALIRPGERRTLLAHARKPA